MAMTKPLSVVQLRNPEPPTPYVFGDSTKPFPNDDKYFNFVLLGPLDDDDGPLLKAAGDVKILGQKMGWLFASAGRSGLNGDVGKALTLKLGPLGKVESRCRPPWLSTLVHRTSPCWAISLGRRWRSA